MGARYGGAGLDGSFEGIRRAWSRCNAPFRPACPIFRFVGLPDKAVSEAKERVRAALAAMSIALPSKRITVNLSPADMPKKVAFRPAHRISVLAALRSYHGKRSKRPSPWGTVARRSPDRRHRCPALRNDRCRNDSRCFAQSRGAEAAWVGRTPVFAANSLNEVVRHYTGQSILQVARPAKSSQTPSAASSAMSKDRSVPRGPGNRRCGPSPLLMIGTPVRESRCSPPDFPASSPSCRTVELKPGDSLARRVAFRRWHLAWPPVP